MADEPDARLPLDEVEYERWLRTATSNRDAAGREAEAGAHHVACSLAEQAAQCSLKGFLHGVGAAQDAYGHGLVRLAEHVAEQVETDLKPDLRAGLQRLAQSYLPARYPDALPEGSPPEAYGPEHSEQSLDDADATMTFVHELWTAVVEAERAEDDDET
jgi:HEPN domain-containing protein